MLWKAELQVVPGEAAGAFSWIRFGHSLPWKGSKVWG